MGSVLCPRALRDTDPLLPQSRPRRSCRVQGLTLNWAGLFPRNLSSRFISAELYWISLGRNKNGGKVFSWDRKANQPVWEEKGRGGTRRSECVVISQTTHKTCPFLDFLPALSVCRYTCAHVCAWKTTSATLPQEPYAFCWRQGFSLTWTFRLVGQKTPESAHFFFLSSGVASGCPVLGLLRGIFEPNSLFQQ